MHADFSQHTRLLVRFEIPADGMRGRGRWRRRMIEASQAIVLGLASMEADSGRHNAS
jgi:hypothetical protein